MKNIIFMGTPDFAATVLDRLIAEKFNIVMVVTQPDKIQGRKKEIVFSPVKELALKHNLKVLQPVKIKEDVNTLINLNADLIVTAAYGQILPKSLLDNIKAINVHGSLLPKYRGGAPIQYALFDGLDKTGITIMDMAFKMDAGDIILQGEEVIKADDNFETLAGRLALLGADLLIKVLNGNYPRVKQDESEVSFAYTIKREEEFLNFYDDGIKVINKLRGLLPEPAGSININGNTYKLYKIKKSDIIKEMSPGEIFIDKNTFLIKSKTDIIEVLEIQAPGKKKMNVKDFLNGQKLISSKDYVERGNL